MKQQQQTRRKKKKKNRLPTLSSRPRRRIHHRHHHHRDDDGLSTTRARRRMWHRMLVPVALTTTFIGLVYNLFTSLSLASSGNRESSIGLLNATNNNNSTFISAAYDEFASRANITMILPSSLAAVTKTTEDDRLTTVATNHTTSAASTDHDFSSFKENLRSTLLESLFSTKEQAVNSTLSSASGAVRTSMKTSADNKDSSNSTNTTYPYANAGDASTAMMSVAHETENITSLSCDTVNHHVVNRGNRTLLGQGDDERVLVVGLPKCGTSSLAYFFRQRNGDPNTVCDLYCKIPRKRMHLQHEAFRERMIWNGICMQKAKDYGLPLLETCGNVSVYAQLDKIQPPRQCHFPQITMLKELHQEHPTATFVLNMRNRVHWSHSVYNWKRNLPQRLALCRPNGGPLNEKHVTLQAWYCEHVQRIRQFVTDHPTHALVEVDIESADTGARLAEIFGGKPDYWKRQNANPDNTMTKNHHRHL